MAIERVLQWGAIIAVEARAAAAKRRAGSSSCWCQQRAAPVRCGRLAAWLDWWRRLWVLCSGGSGCVCCAVAAAAVSMERLCPTCE